MTQITLNIPDELLLKISSLLPSPEEIIALRPSQVLQEQIDTLLEKNRLGQLTAEEQKLWEQYQYLEHLVRLAKAKACLKIQDLL